MASARSKALSGSLSKRSWLFLRYATGWKDGGRESLSRRLAKFLLATVVF